MAEKKEEKDESGKSQAQLDYEKGKEFLKENDLGQAANAFHNALIGYQQDGNENGIANIYDNLGDICLQRQEYQKAHEHFDRAYEICSKSKDRFSMFSLEQKKANLYCQSGDYDEAIKRYLEVIDEHTALRSPQGAVDALEILAGIYLKINENAKAADCYKTMASIHKGYKHHRDYEKYMKLAEEISI
nr:tetratricopeptide repeat protein [Desulfobulbaceae bacterium]